MIDDIQTKIKNMLVSFAFDAFKSGFFQKDPNDTLPDFTNYVDTWIVNHIVFNINNEEKNVDRANSNS